MARINTSLHPKLTESAISILHSKNIYTVFDLVPEGSDKLMRYTHLTHQEVLDLKRDIMKLYIGGIRKGSELLSAKEDTIRTGIKSLDILLKGGLRRGHIYEICGLSGSGKSQLGHTVAVNIAADLSGVVHYVDTKGDFSAKRSQMITKGKKLTKNTRGMVLSNIRVTRIASIEQLMNFLHSLKSSITNSEKKSKPKLIVIDSLPALFFETSVESNSPSSRMCRLNYLSNTLRHLSSELNAVFVTINLISQWRESDLLVKTVFGTPGMVSKPFLGKYWLYIPNNRLMIETRNSEARKITVWKSSYMVCGSSCYVNVGNFGVV